MNTNYRLNFLRLWDVTHRNCNVAGIKKSIFGTHEGIIHIIKYPMLKASEGRFKCFCAVEFPADIYCFRQNLVLYIC
jgi:hypothetical protein